jgi:hypothetical protein
LSKIIHPTHSYLTEYAVNALSGNYPELAQYQAIIVEGANQELHELPVTGMLHGVDLNAKRIEHKGTNEGTDDIGGWWHEVTAAYAAGNRQQAYFYLGIMLHMVEDMGVPAHANHVYHQGNLTEFDNFEAVAAQKWAPDFKDVNRKDPGYDNPSQYYAFSGDWTRADAPNYHDRNSFSKFWLTASRDERALVSNREGRTATVAMWALHAAATALNLPVGVRGPYPPPP